MLAFDSGRCVLAITGSEISLCYHFFDENRTVPASKLKAFFRNTVNLPIAQDVDFLEKNQLGSRGFGLHPFGKCYNHAEKLPNSRR